MSMKCSSFSTLYMRTRNKMLYLYLITLSIWSRKVSSKQFERAIKRWRYTSKYTDCELYKVQGTAHDTHTHTE